VAYDRRSPLSCKLHSCENKGGQFPVHLFHYARKRMQSFAVGSEIHCFAVQEMEIQHGPQARRSQNRSHKRNSRYTQSIWKIRSSKAGLIYRSNYGELTVDEMSVEPFQSVLPDAWALARSIYCLSQLHQPLTARNWISSGAQCLGACWYQK